MKTNQHVPKGSYHTFCRKMYGVEEYDDKLKPTYYKHSRGGQIKSVQTQRSRKIDQFNTFQEYMSNLNQQDNLNLNKISKTVQGKRHSKYQNQPLVLQQRNIQYHNVPKTQRQSRIRSQRKDLKSINKQGANQMIGAFLPFFKIKLQKDQVNIKNPQKQFRIDNRKFKLKSLLIQENKFISQKWYPVM